MSGRDKIIRASKCLASIVLKICGGWFGLMSGVLSIPCAFVALFSQGHQKTFFAFLAFVALLLFAIRVAWTNYKILEKQKLSLEIESVPCLGEREAHCFVRIRNPSTADTTGVEVKLMRITPAPFHPNQKNVPVLIQYPILLCPRYPGGEIIHPLTSSDFLLFAIFQSGFGIFLRLYDGAQQIEFGTEIKNVTPAIPFLSDDFDRYTVEMQVSAIGRLPTVAQFNLSFSTVTGKSLFSLSPC